MASPLPEVPAPNPVTREWIAARLARGPAQKDEEDFPRYFHPPERTPVPAAVLVPIIHRLDGPTLLFTQRTAHLSDHAGQISFPGGRVEDTDADRVETALRETEEETGLSRARVSVLGILPEYDIPSGFRVTPVVAWVEPPFELSPDPFEVAEVFEVPLAHFLNPAHHRRNTDTVNQSRRHFFSMPYGERYIWGATAGMLHVLYQQLMNP
jgi:8-oxo-dGTP pyrophosphatase MutT (NUDIX family)